MEPLRQTWQAALEALEVHINDRQRYLARCRRYHDKHTEVDAELYELSQQLEQAQADRDLQHFERVHKLKKSQRREQKARDSATQTYFDESREAESSRNSRSRQRNLKRGQSSDKTAHNKETKIPRPVNNSRSPRREPPHARRKLPDIQHQNTLKKDIATQSPTRRLKTSCAGSPLVTLASKRFRDSSPSTISASSGPTRSDSPSHSRTSRAPNRKGRPFSPHSQSSQASDGRKRRKLPQIKPKSDKTLLQGAAALPRESDTESGYGETLLTGRSGRSSALDLQSQLDADSENRTLSYAWTQTSPRLVINPALAVSPTLGRSSSAPASGANGDSPLVISDDDLENLDGSRSRAVSFGENSEFQFSNHSSSSSLRSSRDNVLRAALEADRNMQEFMREQAEHFASGGSETWQITADNGEAASGGVPVAVEVMPELTYEGDTADVVADRPSSRHGQSGQSTPSHHTGGLPDGSVVSNESVFGQAEEGEADTPSRTVRDAREVRVLEQHTTLSKHVSVIRPQDILSGASNSDELAGDADDAASWNSADTEPELLSETVEMSDTGTQTPRHRSTQTPTTVATQTPKARRRRKLPRLPNSADADDVASEDGAMSWYSLDSGGTEMTESEQGTPQCGNTTATQTKIKALQVNKRVKPLYTWKSDHSSAESDDHVKLEEDLLEPGEQDTNPALMQTMHFDGTGSFKSSNRQASPERHVSPDRESTLRRTAGMPPEPNYLKDYRHYIESFDGTASGPFVPGGWDGKSYDATGGGFLSATRSHSGSPGKQHKPKQNTGYSQPRDNTNVPKLKLRDHTSEASGYMGNTIPGANAPVPGRYSERPDMAFMAHTSPPELLAGYSGQQQVALPSDDEDEVLLSVVKDFQSQTTRNHKTQTPGYAVTQTPRTFVNGDDSQDPIGDMSFSSSLPRARADTRDASMQTPSDNATQTPLRIRLRSDVTGYQPGRQINISDTVVLDTEDTHSLAAWSLLNTSDLENRRDFSTQTFGQVSHQLNAGTQTGSDEPQVDLSLNVPTQSRSNLVPNSLAGLTQIKADNAQGIPLTLIQSSPRPERLQAEKPDKETQPTHSAPRPRVDSDIFERPSRDRARRESHKTSQKSHSRDRDNESVMTGMSSKKDILQFMLDQVRALKTKYGSEKSPDRKTGHKTKADGQRNRSQSRETKHRPHYRESDSAIDSMAEDPDRYSRRRLELLYRQPRPDRGRGGLSDGEIMQRSRRAPKVEGYYSDRPGRYDRARDLRHKMRDKYSPDRRPRSSYGGTGDRHYSPSRHRRAITPPPRIPDPEYSRARPQYRDTVPSRRALPTVPVRHGPPSAVHFGSNRRLPQAPAGYANVAPPQVMPPQGNLFQPGMRGPSAFQPVQSVPFQPPVIMPPQPQPIVVMPAPPSEPQYVLVEQPEIVYGGGEPAGEPEAPSRRARNRGHQSLDESLTLANRAAQEMKSLTSKLQRQ